MTNRYEGVDHMQHDDGMQGGGFMLGLLAGAVIGTGLGMLFAPKPGAELRNTLSEQANDLASNASKQYRKAAATANQYAERGRDLYNTAREVVNRGADQAEQYARDATENVSDRVSSFSASISAPEVPRS